MGDKTNNGPVFIFSLTATLSLLSSRIHFKVSPSVSPLKPLMVLALSYIVELPLPEPGHSLRFSGKGSAGRV